MSRVPVRSGLRWRVPGFLPDFCISTRSTSTLLYRLKSSHPPTLLFWSISLVLLCDLCLLISFLTAPMLCGYLIFRYVAFGSSTGWSRCSFHDD